jgi:tripartite-type tricarboxylate transporter receptor subunit TctC
MKLRWLGPIALTALAALCSLPIAAQAAYPDHTIRILVPIPPGGAPDVAARLIGEALSQTFGQSVVIENRPGANGNIAGEVAAKATPDGYTLLLAADSGIVINPHVYRKQPFDTLKDLVPISSVASNQFVLAVNPSVPAKTLPEFVEYARKANPPLTFASGGVGSQQHFAMEMLMHRANFRMVNVTYRGGSPAMAATIAGHTQALIAGAASAGQFKAGTLRGLAVSGKARSERFPGLPTIGEFYPGYAVDIWLGLFAPAGTPKPIVDKLYSTVHALLLRPDFAKKINVSGSLEPLALTPAEFSDLIHKDYDKFGKLVKEYNIQMR